MAGTPTANVRAGAGVEHGLKFVLKEGDQVTIDKAHDEWLLITALDGRQGYVHKNLVKPIAATASASPRAQPVPAKAAEVSIKASIQPTEVAPVATEAAAEPAVQPEPPAVAESPASAQAVKTRALEGKSPSLLQMLEGRETEVKIALGVAFVGFILGWLCGWRFYVWRGRKRSRKFRF